MVHCGYEPSAVADTFGSLRGLMTVAKLFLFSSGMKNRPLAEPDLPVPKPHFNEPPRSSLVELTVLD